MKAGDELKPLVKEPVTRLQLVKYAGASGDFNPIHWDPERAQEMGLGGVIAHGMLSMGFLGQYVAGVAGPESVRRLKVRFGAMVRPDDVLTCKGTVREVDGSRAVLDVWAENQDGEKVTTGEAEVEIG
ncbi:MAG: MaoC/PaaZ C-terminal domain-containing protein [Gaiellaceae bacterium]